MGHSLIDAAVKVCGSRYKLAQRVRLSQSYLSEVYNGKQALSPLAAAKIAAEAGLDAKEAAAVAMIENEKDPAEREALKRVFFRTGAAAMLLFSITAGSLAPSPASAATRSHHPGTASAYSGLYIMSTRRRRKLVKVRRWLAKLWSRHDVHPRPLHHPH